MNTYAYVGGNPLRYTDPLGLLVTPETAFDVVSLGLSINEYNKSPSFLNGLGVAVDGLGTLIPLVPAGIGIIRQCDNIIDAAKINQPKLKRIHSDETLNSGSNKFDLESQRTRSTEDITNSLKPGATEPLKVKPDGRIFDGNTRIKVLEERGVDINSLPRTSVD